MIYVPFGFLVTLVVGCASPLTLVDLVVAVGGLGTGGCGRGVRRGKGRMGRVVKDAKRGIGGGEGGGKGHGPGVVLCV